ncbi:QWRF motif-containing protein 7 [Cicer arietinum]|uniref:QWRF motif-containing protein 7 n=1 Tax=Cicer arietinum TaxID=3827 RepID=A0A1S2Y5I1_CICAR|nr:QWRF motif-containing protein 7 [Cicer arietinum]
MAKNARSLSGRCQLTVVPPSPRLVRSQSGGSLATITTHERISRRFNSSEKLTNNQRSKSTSKVSIENNQRNTKLNDKKKNGDGVGKLLQRGVSLDHNGASKRTTLPSAWALSPGRQSLGSPIWFDPPAKANGSNSGNGGGRVGNSVTKVLNYFKTRKVSSMQEEVYHKFKILHNRLLQWRFINARADISMARVKNAAEINLFSVWVGFLMLRKIIIQKRIEVQKVKHTIKLQHILNGQLSLLIEWKKLEKRNQESIEKLTKKLLALSTLLPLTHDLKVDTNAILEALNTATKAMENVDPLIMKYQTKVERILYQVTELTTTSRQEEECLQELLGIVPVIATLLVKEKNIQVHLIQTKIEFNTADSSIV